MVRGSFPALGDAADRIGSIQVRNLATIGGSVCKAEPLSDMVPSLLIHDARLSIHGPEGRRELPLDDFFDGPGKTRLKVGEILTGMALPFPSEPTGSVYAKLIRRSSMEFPLLGVAARVSFDPSGTARDGRIALASPGLRCFRAKTAEALLPGERINEDLLQQIGMAALRQSKPRDTLRCSAQYQKEMIPILVARAVRQCYDRAFPEEGKSQ